MFLIGLAVGAVLMFVVITIYSSLAMASRSDKHIRAQNWDYYEEEVEATEEVEEYDSFL